jgi:hypothetical protein
MYQLSNHLTSKISIISFWMKNCLRVFKIRGVEGGIRVPKHGGPLDSTKAGLLNHQTSINSINSFWMKISLWVFKIRGLEGGIQVPKHLRIVQSHFGPKILFGCMNFEGLKVELGVPSVGDPLIPPGRGC